MDKASKSNTWTVEEKAAMRERARELKAQARKEDSEKLVLAAIAKMPELDQSMAKKIHELVKEVAPELTAKTWYGMPAYAKDDKVVCFFQAASKFDTRYSTLGFNDTAKLDDGNMWPASFALIKITAKEETKIKRLIKQATS